MIAALVASAWAGELLLSGGLSTVPAAGSLLAPSWRAGWTGEHLSVYGTVGYASFHADLGEDFEPRRWSGFWLRPRVGARWAFGDPAFAPYVAASAATALFTLQGGKEDVLEQEDVTGRLPLGATGAVGLRGAVTDHVGVCAELGLDWENARFVEDRVRVTELAGLSTLASVWIDLRL